jgi:hypothetical protein
MLAKRGTILAAVLLNLGVNFPMVSRRLRVRHCWIWPDAFAVSEQRRNEDGRV